MELIVFAIGLCVYFFPTAIALTRETHNRAPIFAMNLLLGWTVIGWIGVLVWSLMPGANSRRVGNREPAA